MSARYGVNVTRAAGRPVREALAGPARSAWEWQPGVRELRRRRDRRPPALGSAVLLSCVAGLRRELDGTGDRRVVCAGWRAGPAMPPGVLTVPRRWPHLPRDGG